MNHMAYIDGPPTESAGAAAEGPPTLSIGFAEGPPMESAGRMRCAADGPPTESAGWIAPPWGENAATMANSQARNIVNLSAERGTPSSTLLGIL